MTIAIGTIVRSNNTDKYYAFCDELGQTTRCSRFAVPDFDTPESVKNNPTSPESVQYRCNLLNKLKTEIFKADEYEYIIFCEHDLVTYPNVLRIMESCERLKNEPQIAGVSSFCISNLQGNLIYYDILSLIIGGKIQNHKIWLTSEIPNDIFVDSAYGGLIIYYAPIIKQIDFKPVIIEGYFCPNHPIQRVGSEFCGMNLQLRQQNLQILISRNQITYK